MTTIAIPIPQSTTPSSNEVGSGINSRSPAFSPPANLFGSPRVQLSLSQRSNAGTHFIPSSESKLHLSGPSLPPTPPANSSDNELDSFHGVIVPGSTTQQVQTVGAGAHRQSVVAADSPQIHSGSFIDNFKAAVGDVDIDQCDAHGENAFFVCDLAEVYKQHMRWMKELGFRVQPFFGKPVLPIPHQTFYLPELPPCAISRQIQPRPICPPADG